MDPGESSSKEHVVFLRTQERLIGRTDFGTLDLVVVDEFYKLDPNRKDERSVALNAAVYKLLKNAKQFFFLGPNIEKVILSDDRWQFEFLKTRFSTVAVDTYDLRKVQKKEERLLKEAYEAENWPALIFVSSPDNANNLAITMQDTGKVVGAGGEMAVWIRENFGPTWALAEAVQAGLGIHHGRLPRALVSRFVAMFNEGTLPILVCTSTLIEGVNTAAQSVLIYDKTIPKESFDFFTFSNIRGRAGRLGQHYVGKVFLFHEPPGEENIEVVAPLFGNLEHAPDEFVVHVGKDDSTPRISQRVADLSARLGLDDDELRRLSGLGIDTLLKLRSAVRTAVQEGLPIG